MLGRVGHQSAHGAAVGSGSEGGRRPRRVSRHIALHVAESLTQKVTQLSAAADRFGTLNRRSALAAGTALMISMLFFPSQNIATWPRSGGQLRRLAFTLLACRVRENQLTIPRIDTIICAAE